MVENVREEYHHYTRGYNDAARGGDWATYNDSLINVTGPLIIWRLTCLGPEHWYWQGYSDYLEDSTQRSQWKLGWRPRVVGATVCLSVVSLVLVRWVL